MTVGFRGQMRSKKIENLQHLSVSHTLKIAVKRCAVCQFHRCGTQWSLVVMCDSVVLVWNVVVLPPLEEVLFPLRSLFLGNQ